MDYLNHWLEIQIKLHLPKSIFSQIKKISRDWQLQFESHLFTNDVMQKTIWKSKKNELVLAVRTLRQLTFASELMKVIYTKK